MPSLGGKHRIVAVKALAAAEEFIFLDSSSTDGQANALLETYLRHFVSANQQDWMKLLDKAKFSYSLLKSESRGASPFEIVNGE